MKGPISRDRAAALRGGRGGLGRSVLVGLAHLAQSCGSHGEAHPLERNRIPAALHYFTEVRRPPLGHAWSNVLLDDVLHVQELVVSLREVTERLESVQASRRATPNLHRDLKPQNIGWLNGQLKLFDFDIAKNIASGQLTSGTPRADAAAENMNHTVRRSLSPRRWRTRV